MSSVDSDVEGLSVSETPEFCRDGIFSSPCSRYEQFINLHYRYTQPSKNSRQARFKAAQVQWSAAKKTREIDTVMQSMQSKIKTRPHPESKQRSQFRSFFDFDNVKKSKDTITDAGMFQIHV